MITIWLPSHNHGSRKWVPSILVSFYVRKDYDYTHIQYIPGTKMTLVLIGKCLVLVGWPSKIEVIWVPGTFYIFLSFACLFDFRVDPNAWNSWFPFTTVPSVFPWLLMRAGTGLVVGVKLGSCNSYSGIQDYSEIHPEIQHGTWKWWFPIGISFSKGPFSGSMFVLGGVSWGWDWNPLSERVKGFLG